MEHIATLHTIGDGYWSNVERRVHITKLEVPCVNEDLCGELRVYFDTASWDVKELGLIYTDTLFEFELKEWLDSIGYTSEDIGYSEQGMQEYNYVSFDIGPRFVNEWAKKNEVEYV